jgi:hypothetical protein
MSGVWQIKVSGLGYHPEDFFKLLFVARYSQILLQLGDDFGNRSSANKGDGNQILYQRSHGVFDDTSVPVYRDLMHM